MFGAALSFSFRGPNHSVGESEGPSVCGTDGLCSITQGGCEPGHCAAVLSSTWQLCYQLKLFGFPVESAGYIN